MCQGIESYDQTRMITLRVHTRKSSLLTDSGNVLPFELIQHILETAVTGLEHGARTRLLLQTCLLHSSWLESSIELLHRHIALESEPAARRWLSCPRGFTPQSLVLSGAWKVGIGRDGQGVVPGVSLQTAIQVLDRCTRQGARKFQALKVTRFTDLPVSFFSTSTLSDLQFLTLISNDISRGPSGSSQPCALSSLVSLTVDGYFWNEPFQQILESNISSKITILRLIGRPPSTSVQSLRMSRCLSLREIVFDDCSTAVTAVFRHLPQACRLSSIVIVPKPRDFSGQWSLALWGALSHDHQALSSVKEVVVEGRNGWVLSRDDNQRVLDFIRSRGIRLVRRPANPS
ncbi:hypothetical protein T439DRAFT_377359 [Meredithblackwellia eburnea MCA 4105]